MEQPSTRTPQRKVRRTPPVPRPAAPVGQGERATVYRAGPGPGLPPLRQALERMPAARLTGLGSGLLTALGMLAIGAADSALLDGSPAVYGVFFIIGSVACALWVRPADLITAPISAPIAYAVGGVPISGGGDGFGSQLMGLITLLSLNAGWLYAGTLLAALIALVRRIALIRARRRERNRQRKRPSRLPRSPRCSPAGRERSPR
ncbi:DUF6542 domain-containing protein [Streptomyces netropsis]|uniref:Membrane protein implicated in regulation of membrane protease activity n=1 Tax=Streptomyces netropsis TaxID=55404 RepID=A0A7W7LAH3_STRNE|nr:DUF6542 domain-containing protein [Streptomyces netropsis]MBB4886061.1 membrane protein implicated in regulation of membrane protease activity [Streptomyces netropsis]